MSSAVTFRSDRVHQVVRHRARERQPTEIAQRQVAPRARPKAIPHRVHALTVGRRTPQDQCRRLEVHVVVYVVPGDRQRMGSQHPVQDCGPKS